MPSLKARAKEMAVVFGLTLNTVQEPGREKAKEDTKEVTRVTLAVLTQARETLRGEAREVPRAKVKALREAAKESSKETVLILEYGVTPNDTAVGKSAIGLGQASPLTSLRQWNRQERRKFMPLTRNSSLRSLDI